ncbi:MAG: alpha/beta hydrolase [Solobacterium sp.]|nr:alpha/beta hydrolase [Solobacterium sp.]
MLAEVNGIQLYYEMIGQGPALIMVHGNGEDHTIFTEAAEKLKGYFTVYLIDSRDHGQSTKVDELHYDDMAEDVIAFLELLDLQDVVYYGFSDGGIIGLLAAMKTDRIGRMIISGTNLTPNGVKPGLKALIRMMYLFRKDQKLRLMLEEPQIRTEQLKQIRIPVAVVAGEKDVIRLSETRKIADNLPDAYVRLVPKAGHGSYIVHKTEIADIILEETQPVL